MHPSISSTNIHLLSICLLVFSGISWSKYLTSDIPSLIDALKKGVLMSGLNTKDDIERTTFARWLSRSERLDRQEHKAFHGLKNQSTFLER